MYAITSNSYRAIADESQAIEGETIVEVLPQSLIDSLAAEETQRTATNTTIRQQTETSLEDLRAYLDLERPTNAQTVAVVKLLCRVCISLIRLNLAKLDGTE